MPEKMPWLSRFNPYLSQLFTTPLSYYKRWVGYGGAISARLNKNNMDPVFVNELSFRL